MVRNILIAIVLLQSQLTFAADFPRVDADLKVYDDTIAAKNTAFDKNPSDPNDKNWVKSKLTHMVDVDQYMRNYSSTPFQHNYSADETKYFQQQFGTRWMQVDSENTNDLKGLLQIYSWFTISTFGSHADRDAWLLVQHADLDIAFQRQVLRILENLYVSGETSPANYAYLFDRVASSFNDPSQRKPQRYGTQGTCTGPGTWEPLPVEDPANLDNLRKEVGLEPMADYIKRFKEICH